MKKRRQKKEELAEEICQILAVLPDRVEDLQQRDILWSDETIEDIGPNYLTYERYPTEVHGMELRQTMGPEDWEEYERQTRPGWGARCKCTFCGHELDALWERHDGKAMIVRGDAEAEGWELYPYGYAAWKGKEITCDACGRWIQVAPKSYLRSGRVSQQVTVSVEEHAGWGCVVYWMQRYEIDKNGDVEYWVLPREALVVSRTGRLLRFTKSKYCGLGESPLTEWEYRPQWPASRKLYQIPYASADAMKRGRTCRAVKWCGVFGDSDLLETSTLEKTGLLSFLREEDFCYEDPGIAEDYLWVWRKHPNLENLAKAGWTHLCYDAIQGRAPGLIRWDKAKPHEMLGMSKPDFRGAGPSGWGAERHRQWLQYAANYPGTAAEAFKSASFRYRGCFDDLMIEAEGSPRWKLEKISGYLQKADMDNAEGLQLLMDYRDMAADRGGLHTERDWWPKNLRALHDTLAQTVKVSGKQHKPQFEALAKELEDLRWNDGRYCIRAAASAEELQEEGRVLHHCVGGYASKHLSRSDVIFFVRKHRRPERNWLTLDIRMNGLKPMEVQLHGWYNEHAPWAPDTPRSEKRWQIPKRARDFVARWEKEILEPWYKEYIYNRLNETDKKARRSA